MLGLDSILKSPMMQKALLGKLPMIIQPLENLIDRVILQDSETYASFSLIKHNNELKMFLITTNESLQMMRLLYTSSVSALLQNPAEFLNIEKVLIEKGVLKDVANN